jgi:inner membrane protein
MVLELVSNLGAWSWWVLGVVLLILEIVVPGVFLFWIGLAAIATGLISLFLWGSALWPWEVQLVLFAAFSIASILIGRSVISRAPATDQPNLNRRAESLVGRSATLTDAIVNGRGRVKLDDTTWSVNGPDLEAGTKVLIVSSTGRDLTVKPL